MFVGYLSVVPAATAFVGMLFVVHSLSTTMADDDPTPSAVFQPAVVVFVNSSLDVEDVLVNAW
jgi:hypothetical protein